MKFEREAPLYVLCGREENRILKQLMSNQNMLSYVIANLNEILAVVNRHARIFLLYGWQKDAT